MLEAAQVTDNGRQSGRDDRLVERGQQKHQKERREDQLHTLRLLLFRSRSVSGSGASCLLIGGCQRSGGALSVVNGYQRGATLPRVTSWYVWIHAVAPVSAARRGSAHRPFVVSVRADCDSRSP